MEGATRTGVSTWRRLSRLAGVVCGLLVFLIQTPASPLVVTGGRVALGSSDWPTYHGDQVHSGLDSSGDSYSSLTQDWTQTLDGSLFASPVVAGGKVIEATENNSVYAFNVVDGSLAWKSHLASPVQSNTLPCGNISPTSGITGTPVVDTSTGTIYVVAYQAGQSGDDHILFALDLNSGSTKWSRTVNPVVGTALAHQQRGALALGSGKVYIPYGGLDGDCGDYHGALIGVNADGSGTNYSYTVSSREAGMWNAAGPSIDGSGNVFTVTGNGDPSKLGGQESVIKVSPTLQYEDSFTASNWSALDQADTDLGSLGVSLLDNNLAFTAGKGGTGYLLNQTALGGVGGQIYSAGICSSAAGGSAYQSPILYVPCTNGVTAVKIDPVAKNFSVLWTQSASNGSPIVAGGMVWALSGGNLVGMDPITGHVDITRSVGGATRFATPASSGGRLFIALNNQLLALAGPAVRPPDSGRPWPGGSDAVGAGAGSTNAYFAEGFTGPNFHEYLTVENPGAAQTLTAIYDFASGSQLSKTYSLGANSRTTIDVNGEVGYYQQVSTHLSAPNPFVAERPMYFDFPGGITGGDDAMGVQAPGQQFYFAEGYTGFQEYLTLLNPGSTIANVTVTYVYNGAAPKPVTHQVAANSRLTILVDDPAEAGPNRDVSMEVQSDQPIVAERPMYFNYLGRPGGSVVAGVSAPASHLDLAEGFVSPSFDEYLSVLNPGMTAATANITYLVSGGAPFTQVVGVPANSRQTVHVNQVLQPYVSAAIHIDSTQPLVVERPMYFVYNGWTGGHDAVATSSASLTSTAYFAEGTTLPQFREYLTVENPNAGTVPVTLTYYTASGTVVKGLGLAGLSRTTIQVFAGDMSANGACDPVTSCGVGSGVPGVSVLVQATGAQPILVERPMYFDY